MYFSTTDSEELVALKNLLQAQTIPLFLEGRAGSGKSTVLVYYFAEVLSQAQELGPNTSERPVFITQSEKLLKNAREVIDGLVRSRCAKKGCAPPSLEDAFLTFHEFCTRQLPDECKLRFDRTRPGGYVSHRRFRELYSAPDHVRLANRPPKDLSYRGKRPGDASPELIWFIIRSYIKGFQAPNAGEAKRWLDPESFIKIPRPDRHVTPALYEKIYRDIWEGWYRQLTVPSEDNDNAPWLWDDQDLAWEVLSRGKEYPTRYSLIVCDEAQDFTRVEMCALLRALVFSGHDLRSVFHNQQCHLPIAFAGDPSQTINPSGFRKEGIDNSLKLVMEETELNYRDLSVHHQPLHYNYRNKPPIFRMANAVQLARKVLLGYSLEPQNLWKFDPKSPAIRRLILGKNATIDDILEKTGVVVLPDESSDAFWQCLDLSMTPEKLATRKGIESPATVKGLEFPKVIVLGFGAFFARHLFANKQLANELREWWKWRDATEDPAISPGCRLSLEYFLNCLYVAVTRATDELFLVDTQDGWDRFWLPFRAHLEDWRIENPDWKEELAKFDTEEGDRKDLDEKNPLDRANEYAQRAEQEGSPDHARTAAYYFNAGDRPRDAHEQEAYALYLEGHLREAAHCMRDQAKNPNKAREWLWEGCVWDDIAEDLDHKPEHRVRVAAQMRESHRGTVAWVLEMKSLIEEEESKNSDMYLARGPNRTPWTEILRAFLSGAAECVDETSADCPPEGSVEVIKSWYVMLRRYRDAYELDPRQLGKVAFGAQKYHEAVDMWTSCGYTNFGRFNEAMAYTLGYPESLLYWRNAGRNDKIVDLFEKNRRDWLVLTESDRGLVASALDQRHTFNDAFVLEPLTRGLDKIRELGERDKPKALDRFADITLELAAKSSEKGQVDEGVALLILNDNPAAARLWERLSNTEQDKEKSRELWKSAQPLIAGLVTSAQKQAQQAQSAGEIARARDWAEFALQLVWSIAKSRKQGERDVAQVQNYLRGSSNRESAARDLQFVALQTVAAGRRGWVQENWKATGWERLGELVYGIAEFLVQELIKLDRSSERLQDKQAEWWNCAARVAEESNFRLHAVDFFEFLVKLYRRSRVSRHNLNLAERGLKEAKERHALYRDEDALGPGGHWVGEQTILRVLSNEPTVRIEYEPNLLGARVNLGNGNVQPDSGVLVRELEESEKEIKTKVQFEDKWLVQLSWERESHRLRIRVGNTEKQIWYPTN